MNVNRTTIVTRVVLQQRVGQIKRAGVVDIDPTAIVLVATLDRHC